MDVTNPKDKFSRLVEDALRIIPRRFRDAIQNMVIVVEDEPSAALLNNLGMDDDETLFGLYEGTPLPERGATYGNVLPDRITIFQGPIEEDCGGDEEIRRCVAETLIHEVGHYFGMTEEEIEHIEHTYWRKA